MISGSCTRFLKIEVINYSYSWLFSSFIKYWRRERRIKFSQTSFFSQRS